MLMWLDLTFISSYHENYHIVPGILKNTVLFLGSLHLVSLEIIVGIDLALSHFEEIAGSRALVDLVAVSLQCLQWSKKKNRPLQLSGVILGFHEHIFVCLSYIIVVLDFFLLKYFYIFLNKNWFFIEIRSEKGEGNMDLIS